MMNRMMTELVRLVRGEEGTEVVEWALVAGLIVVLAAATFATIGANVNTVFTEVESKTGEAAANAGGGTGS